MIAYISAPKGTSNNMFRLLERHIKSAFIVDKVIWWDSSQSYDTSMLSRVDRVFFLIPALQNNDDTYCIGKGQYSEYQRCLNTNIKTLAIGNNLVMRELIVAKAYMGRPSWVKYAKLKLGKMFTENKKENEEILLLL